MFKPVAPFIAAMMVAGMAHAENVEIYVVDMLDNIQDGYCLDIAKGRGADANPDDGLQAHTCYSPSGEVLVDQAFDPDQFADGVLYMPEFDVCVQTTSTEAGAAPELADCDGSDAQSWVFDGEGTIAPASAPDMCLTLTGETRTGRSDQNQMIALSLQTCSSDLTATQTWSNRTAD
ncbi:ricin-type beta-trefoil lectin domain protein [uncultured Tateyamaria sp.]|uniref:ricin-type beta-trefoil lectin domain protein n=1 Tax=uncultured Tateyamaria sp. TaxID=455651 RepID=UPI00261E64EE|nr:ricin-type beta-trefoil lectin domain protein [uncultured Tateyamaria sp.]